MLWQRPQNFPILKNNEVHVWRALIKHPEDKIIEFSNTLTSKEKERASKFMVKHAANSFIAARAILRTLLSKYLGVGAQDLVFKQNQYGKPYLDSSPLQFNLSHSHDFALFVFALNNPVGVDVEYIRSDYDFVDIAKRFFSPNEVNELFSLPKHEQSQAFFNCWARKEAFIKGLGVGMFKELNKFSVEVSYKKEGRVSLLFDQNEHPDSSAWSLEALDPLDGYAGAFAVATNDYQLVLNDV